MGARRGTTAMGEANPVSSVPRGYHPRQEGKQRDRCLEGAPALSKAGEGRPFPALSGLTRGCFGSRDWLISPPPPPVPIQTTTGQR